MRRFMTRKLAILAALVVAVGAIGGGVAIAAGGDDDGSDTPITGAALQKASSAALAHTGGGKVTGTEVGDEDRTLARLRASPGTAIPSGCTSPYCTASRS